MARSWRDWKARVKKNGYSAYNTNQERLENCPDGVVAEQWSSLIQMWNLESSQVNFLLHFIAYPVKSYLSYESTCN